MHPIWVLTGINGALTYEAKRQDEAQLGKHGAEGEEQTGRRCGEAGRMQEAVPSARAGAGKAHYCQEPREMQDAADLSSQFGL